ncbi:hypothetical protein LTR36_003691 [Oleoguttula mirabilis]|uniref:Uncharacterized protein n=1 Tax=Oleoguttula mirabilis TaxID=1507867 RepID=A0AAV9JIA4_9PEZI|nr:hypothetical protein LTR36_003691 [Oleoguttula mirabilis]
MAIHQGDSARLRETLTQTPQVSIFLRPIAPPAALGLAGFAGSTWITASWIANWWGNDDSPTLFFPFVAFWGGLSQFIAGIYGFQARDILVTVINTMWGAFWMSIGVLYLLVAVGSLPAHSIYTQFPELASWFVVLTFFTWSCALAACARDVILAALLFCLAIGSTIACCLFSPDAGRHAGIKVAAYFWMASALLAWWRVTAYLVEEAYGADSKITKFFPIFRTSFERDAGYVVSGMGEPGVKRGVPKMVSEKTLLAEAEKESNGARHHA